MNQKIERPNISKDKKNKSKLEKKLQQSQSGVESNQNLVKKFKPEKEYDRIHEDEPEYLVRYAKKIYENLLKLDVY